jgi:hypothetical protein
MRRWTPIPLCGKPSRSWPPTTARTADGEGRLTHIGWRHYARAGQSGALGTPADTRLPCGLAWGFDVWSTALSAWRLTKRLLYGGLVRAPWVLSVRFLAYTLGMKRLAQSVLFSSVCLAFVAGCGDNATRTPPSATPVAANASPSPATNAASDDTALAASMLMTRDDFSFDYLERKRDAAKNPVRGCGSDTDGRTGSAATGDWLFDGQSPAISETVTVYANEADTSAHIAAAPSLIDCAVKAINDGNLNETGIDLSGATSTPMSLDAGGDRSAAFQVQATEVFAGQSAPGTAQYTLVFVSRGRAVAEILVRGTGEPFDREELSGFAQSAVARIQQQQ